MGDWRKDQSKKVRRYVWGETRGQSDETWQDFANRVKQYPALRGLRFEKIGTELHCWRQVKDGHDDLYWTSCLRFKDDGWGYWDVFYRTDEGRWRATSINEVPIGRAVEAGAQWYRQTFIDTPKTD